MLQEAGFQVEAAAFERDYHTGRMPACPVVRLGHIAHGRYVSRAFKMLRALPNLRRAIRRHRAAYASGPDMALFAIIAGWGLRRPVILEVGDIRHAQVAPGWKGRLARRLDRFIANRCAILVVTARGFADGYYASRLGCRTPILVMENKLDEAPLAKALEGRAPQAPRAFEPGTRPLRIGYFGVLRCAWSWHVLTRLAESMPERIRVVAAGYCLDPAEPPPEIRRLPNFEYRGRYRSPEDLPALYGDVDLLWACYPPPGVTDPDWRWAQSICRSNRFYEGCFFKRPLVSMAESGDGEEVRRLGIGLVLADQSDASVLRAIADLSSEDFARWSRNLDRLPRSVSVYTDEAAQLSQSIRSKLR